MTVISVSAPLFLGVKIKYPIGIQTFSDITEGGYAYVDKTIMKIEANYSASLNNIDSWDIEYLSVYRMIFVWNSGYLPEISK